jgi:hypothetical protein|tara:strand:+ start:45 stop:230 length:186 start_codon:yes stop_codon:yes gene_type:complete
MLKHFRVLLCIGFIYGLGDGYALDFDGSNDYSIIFDNNALEFVLSFFTVEFWIGKHVNSLE